MLTLHQVTARAGTFQLADITFDIPQGRYGIVIGPAGAGKTTLLETIAGVVPTTSGRIMIGDADRTHAPPERRDLSIVYQHAYLFPHLTVRENIAYGAVSVADGDEIAERFELATLGDRTVGALSGGERQLVALARALARRPGVLLLDEPFSALDPRTRTRARRLLRAVHDERNFTVLQVTHDFAEAGMLGDTVVVMDRGRIMQQGDAERVFRRPASAYIADFLGAENVFDGVAVAIESEAGVHAPVRTDDQVVERPVSFATGALHIYAISRGDARPTHAVIRAEEVSLSVETAVSSVQNQFRGRILEISPAGALRHVTVDVSGTLVVAAVTGKAVRELELVEGSEVVVGFKATAVHLC